MDMDREKSLENRDWTLKNDFRDRQREFYKKHPEKLMEDIFSLIQRNVPPEHPESYHGVDRVKTIWRYNLDNDTFEVLTPLRPGT